MKWILAFFILVFAIACVSIPKLFISINDSVDKTYGYTLENPICIGYYSDWKKNTDAVYYFISRLQKDGHPLRFVMHSSYRRQNAIQSRTTIPLRFGYESNMDNLLDRFDLVVKGSKDTTMIVLYFDVILKGELRIPIGLKFIPTQVNNLYQL